MATIDQLNFEVILDDKEFNAKVKEDIRLANELNTSLSQLLTIKNKVGKFTQDDVNNNRKANQILVDNARAQEKITREKNKTLAAQQKLNAQIDRATRSYNQQSRILNELKGVALGYLSVHGASQLLSSLVRVTGEFELQKTTLSAMIGDLNTAENIIAKIQGLAVESPFQFKELTTYAKQLSAFSVPAQELYDTTKMLADVSAGLGVGMDRIVLAYGQVRSAAFLRGQEVRQFTEAGIPILDELAKQFSELEGRVVSTGEVFDKISARLVPFEMVAKVFKDMTSEGGKFYNMQEVQAETLRGKLSNLKDAYEVMLNEIGKGQSENLNGAVDWARKLMQNYENTGKILVELVAAYGVYKVALVTATNLQSTLARNLVVLRREFRALTATLSANPYVLLAAGITAVGYGIYKASTSLKDYEKIQKAVADTQKDYNSNIATEISKLDALYAKLRVAKKGTEEYDKAKRAIYTQYSSYISELKNEGIAVDNLAIIYNKLKDKITEATKARYRMTAAQGAEQEYSEGVDKLYKRFELLTKNMGKSIKRELMEVEKEAIWQYIMGDENALNISEAEGIRSIAKDKGPSGYGYLLEKAKKDAKDLVDTYAEAKERIARLFGEGAEIEGGITQFVYPEAEPEGKSPTEVVQEQIDSVRRLKSAYDTLAPYMNGDMLKKTLTALFPNADQQLIQSLDFRGKLVELAAKLNEFDQEASKKLLDSISGEKASEIASAFKAVETYKNMLDDWLGEDFNLTGEGVAFDISKIIRDLNNQYAKINQKAIQASDLLRKAQEGDEAALATVREVYGEEVWQKYLINGKATIDELARLEREEAKKTSDEKIRNLSSKYVSEQMEKNNIDLSDFGDKTTKQVQALIDRMKSIREEAQRQAEESFVDVVLGEIDEGQYARWQMMLDVVEQLGQKIEDTEEELENKATDNAIETTKAIAGLGSEMENLGSAIEDSGIENLGKSLSDTANLAAGLMDAIQKDDTIAIIASLVTYVTKTITDVAAKRMKVQQELYEASLEYRELMNESRRGEYENMFGVDEMGLATENLKILTEAYRDYQKTVDSLNKKSLQRQKVTGGTQIHKVSTTDVLEYISKNQGWELYRENGELNIDAIKAYYDGYVDFLTRKQKKKIQALIDSEALYADAATQQAEYLKDLFGGVADDIATSMVDAFIESGDAAIDMGNIISDVSKKMVADLIKSIYLMPILNDYAEKLNAVNQNSALTPTEKAEIQLGILETALQEISAQSGAITDTIERFEDYFGAGKEPGTSALGEGIKGITEDQANLLASYLNAIRADVSYSKAIWERMDANLQRIADMFASSPTLMEYQAQIAANTFDTAQATQAILGELRSVMTSDGGDTAIRIYS